MLLSFFRILKFSLQDISRNVWLSIITITIIILAMLSINTLVVLRVVSDNAVLAIKERIDLSLYIKDGVSDDDIFKLRNEIGSMSEVKMVRYISREEALGFFQERNKNNPEVLQALDELGRNPLSPSLVVSPENADLMPALIERLKGLDRNIVESQDFSDNRMLLEKIDNITSRVNDIGFVVILIFVITSLLVVYNSIKVAVYTQKREIEIMRLVGASNSFVYLPFVFSSIIYTLIAAMIMIIFSFPLLGILQPYLEMFFIDYNINIISYFVNNFISIFGWQFFGISFINIVASYLAVKKYANI